MINKKNTKILFFTFIICFVFYITIISAQGKKVDCENGYLDKWNEKVWLTLGDSITKANGYQPIVKEKLGFSRVENKGINGQTMAYQKTNESTYSMGKNINYKEYDLVTIFIGTNDYRYNKKLGKIEEKSKNIYDESTLIGSYQMLIEKILSSNPYIELVLITPLQRTKDGYDMNHTNEVGSKLIDYVNATKALGEKYSLPVLDLYSTSGFTDQTMKIYTRDNLHPNKNGYERISEKMYRFLLNI